MPDRRTAVSDLDSPRPRSAMRPGATFFFLRSFDQLQPDNRLARAQIVITKPKMMKTSVRMSGGRSRSVSSRGFCGGRTNANPGPTTRAAPNASARNGSRFSPRNGAWASTKFLSRFRRICPMLLVSSESPSLDKQVGFRVGVATPSTHHASALPHCLAATSALPFFFGSPAAPPQFWRTKEIIPCSPSGGAFNRHAGSAPEALFALLRFCGAFKRSRVWVVSRHLHH